SAIDGRTIDRRKLVERGIFGENVKYTDGAVGNALSHLRLWNRGTGLREPITVAEDDAIFHRSFDSLAPEVIAQLPPDWHIIFWGWNFDSCTIFDLLPGISMIWGCLTAANIPSRQEAFQNMPLRPAPYRLLCCFGIPCYSISPAGAERLASLAVPIRHFTLAVPGLGEIYNASIDIVLISLCKKINAYASFPPLVLTPNERTRSTVQNR
ncbi:MAG: glycosyltransferase family 25 protein, partial [Stellaceae bacterium]